MTTEYFYLSTDNQRVGPFSLEELIPKINVHTLIWKAGLPQWTSASLVEEVAQRLNSQPTPPPPPPPSSTYEGDRNNPYAAGRYDTPPPPQQQPCPPTYLIWAILVTIFCCLPFGIIAIYQASQVEKYYGQKDYTRARSASVAARNWCWASVISVAILWSAYVMLIFLGLSI